jgi:hypothetical protein
MKFAAFCLAVIAGCSSQTLLAQNSSVSPTPTPSLEQRVSDLERRLQAIESVPGIALMLNLKGSLQANSTAQPTPSPQIDAPLELMRWEYRFKAGQSNDENQHLITYVLKNRTDKSIKLVDASIVFTDLLGEKLIAIKLFPDRRYSAGEPATVSGVWDVNQFEPSQLRMATMDHDDVKATLVIRKVVFSDNTIWSAGNGQ